MATCLFSLTAIAFVFTDNKIAFYAVLGQSLAGIVVLIIQVTNGAFKRQVIKSHHIKLMGHFRAAVIGMVLLQRARRRMASPDYIAPSRDNDDGDDEDDGENDNEEENGDVMEHINPMKVNSNNGDQEMR